jgi:MoaA/NifB/PqqE/SkfB family radical SAM enzyme
LWPEEKMVDVALDETDAGALEKIIRDSFVTFKDLYAQRFIAESPDKMLQIVQYYRGLLGLSDFPRKRCNAPWTSAVVEANGDVRPCFFHEAYGNISVSAFPEILNSKEAVRFRKHLDMRTDPVCKKCVCSLHVPLMA